MRLTLIEIFATHRLDTDKIINFTAAGNRKDAKKCLGKIKK